MPLPRRTPGTDRSDARAYTRSVSDLRAPLRELFGFEEFLPGQEAVVERALKGCDTLALMPTGSGKSLPYQLAAMLRPSPTLVVSPLIALMKDQVDKLPPPVAARATLINSSLEPTEARRRVAAVAAGEVKLLYAAPERLRQRSFVGALASAGVGLVVVDEVHCVSMWGHDFRPDYLFIRRALDELGGAPVLGLTATATPDAEREIAASLGRSFDVVRASVVRPNLRHVVDEVEDEEDRRRRLLERIGAGRGAAVVYARSRKKCEELSRLLHGHGVAAAHYHAGLDAASRSHVQEAFLSGTNRVVVATTAFGMGIDKPDIRLVLLYNYPGSLEDYVQMVGRAGRDGEPSECVLFAGRRDAADLRRFARADAPRPEALRALYRRLRDVAADRVAEATPEELATGDADPRVLVGMLEQTGLVRRGYDAGRALRVELLEPPPDAAARMTALLERYGQQALARVDRILRYARSGRCRQAQIAEHFGEAVPEVCGTCDRCARPATTGVRAFADDAERAPRLPDNVGAAILDAVAAVRWPLGKSGLAAMLTGSVSAPPSARRSPSFGLLAAARPGTVKRWLDALVSSGHLEPYESDDGFPLLRRGPASDPPRLAGVRSERDDDDDELSEAAVPLFERLRAWRSERARADGVPAYVVLPDRALRALAREGPASPGELLSVPGIGPAKLERYGEGLLAVIGGDSG